MITFEAASVVAPDASATILHPTSLVLGEQRISIIGANGSGKSTLARLINGLILPSSGAVTVGAAGETPVDTLHDGAAVRRRVGFVFSNPVAGLVMPTAIEDVALSLRRVHRGRREREAAAHAVLDRFGIGHLAERPVHSLSGGQQQLLAVAAVLAVEPAILVADEPTTLLDLRNGRAIGDLLFGLEQQLLLITHDLDLAARADRTLVIDRARVVFDGEPAAAIAHYRSIAGAS